MDDPLLFLWDKLPLLLFGFPGQRPGGLLLSMLLAVVAIVLGFFIASAVGSGCESRSPWLRALCILYVELFRGLPLLLLLVLVHQLLAGGQRYGLAFSPRTSALVALTLYSSAYQSEIVRVGLRAIPLQLIDSARLMGSSPWQLHWLIKMRYTWQVMMPAFTGQAISLFKDTSVVVIIGVAELMTIARAALGSDVRNAPYWLAVYLLVGLLYFGVAFTLSRLAQRWERQRQSADLVHSLANY